MQRDLRRLADTSFDLLVIGGGIYGAAAAWDASQRGLSVAIIDKSDFGGATSFNSAKTLHGGVRALQWGNIAELRLFVRERRALSNIVPHLVQPLPFVIPTYARIARNRWLMRLYFAVNDVLAHDRNDVRDPALRLPPSRLLSRDECLALNTSIDPDGVSGGIEWYDCQMYNSDRVHLSFLLSATRAGAVAANYVEATALLRTGDGVAGVSVYDRLDDVQTDLHARVVLNCAGPWAPQLLRSLAPEVTSGLPAPLSIAMNLVTPRQLVTSHGVAGPAGDRMLFMVPWKAHTIVGTSHDPFHGQAGQRLITRQLVEQFLEEVGESFPGAKLGASDLSLVHRGLLPALDDGAHFSLSKTNMVRDHRKDGLNGLVSVLGVRYTTARDTAQAAVDTVFHLLGKTPPPCRTAETPLVGGDIADTDRFVRRAVETMASSATERTATRLARSYGTTYPTVLERFGTKRGDARELGTTCAVTAGEVRHAVQEEMAVTLSDAMLRRTEAGSAGHPGDDALRVAAGVMAEELGWSAERAEREIAEVTTVYTRWQSS